MHMLTAGTGSIGANTQKWASDNTVFSYTVNKSTHPKHVSSAARDPVEDVTITRRYLSWDLLP